MELKQAIIIRTDLDMKKGKIASQASHASVAAYYKTLKKSPEKAESWFKSMAKIVLKVNSESELLKLKEKAARAGLIAEIIMDAGRTQIAPGSVTALAIGPDEEDKIDAITKDLKLL